MSGEIGDLFAGPAVRTPAEERPADPPELQRARALCRHLRRERTPEGKRRAAHLICLNLKALLAKGARR